MGETSSNSLKNTEEVFEKRIQSHSNIQEMGANSGFYFGIEYYPLMTKVEKSNHNNTK